MSELPTTGRYAGKPFLRLLDSYVLDATGHLDQAADISLRIREPEFREKFGLQGSWRSIVEQRMSFPTGMPGAIREVWDKGKVKFLATHGTEPDPREFARMFVDSKFPH
ncbi:hypothetical protein EKN06_07980 [Croceicoccus ponticola]|uniref:Uncharacterized protein n=1 Tax=Croceicoccus ponticola TaxID=2217664 RepID=A0A437GXJ3_9SPHN|nr:hypothetical protein [Croceicoccus ponticola]RVQ66891.1 hypothetical protein EKN06_07980 [Croceicoccus ponticola]